MDTSMAGMGMDADAGDEPLQAQILSQKRLATYYGEVVIGGQPFKGGSASLIFFNARTHSSSRS